MAHANATKRAIIETLEPRQLLTAIPYHLTLAEQLVANIPITSNSYSYTTTPTVTCNGLSGATAYSNQSDCSTFVRSLLTQAYGFTTSQFTAWTGKSYPQASDLYTAAMNDDGFNGFEQIADLQPGDAIFEKFINPTTDTGHCMFADALPVYVSTTNGQKAYNLTVIDCTASVHSSDTRNVINPQTGSDETGVGRGNIRLYTDLSGNLVSWAWGTSSGATPFTSSTAYFTFAKMPGTTTIPWLAAGSVATWNTSNKTLVVTGPSAIIADPGLSTGVIVTDSDSGQRLDITPAAGAIVHIASITLSGGASADVLGPSTNPVLLDVAAATNNVSIDSTSQLNLGDNDMIVRKGTLAAIQSEIAMGFSGGSWTGKGITSSAAASDSTHLTALAAIQDSNGSTALYTSFEGVSATTTDVIVKYTYYGDANLDGAVDGSDYTKIDNGFNTHATGWLNGDFNYDGVVNGSDYTLIDNAFNTQGTAYSAALIASVITLKPIAKSTASMVETSKSAQAPVFSAVEITAPAQSPPQSTQSGISLSDELDELLSQDK